ncbi:lysine histidine transporter 1-like [Iris pallida]|uniref:Lysine histidine transporter 1-like n=1 Tax=Iris pallida TaxID=29817 RepID=A0AAX6EXJ2_IRIPA|nr:lysine histidine transporter 1-like [Iris pallida]
MKTHLYAPSHLHVLLPLSYLVSLYNNIRGLSFFQFIPIRYTHSLSLSLSLSLSHLHQSSSTTMEVDQGPSSYTNGNSSQKKSAKEKAADEWLPITSSRNAKWWYSAFHNVTAMVGAGVLSLPYAMSELGWGPGIAVLVLSWIITLYTLWQMVEMHEIVPGKRFDRYHELGQHAFGEKLGLWIVVPQQLIVEVGVDIVYMVTGGTSLKKFHDTVCPNCKSIKQTYFIMIFASVHFVLSQLPNFNSISGVSLAAAVMSLSYSTIAWGASVEKGKQDGVEYGYKASSTPGTVFNFFNALGDVAFAYAGHNVVLEIQATIPSTPENPSKKPMWRGVVVAYIVVAICYFPVALVGYWAFGNNVDDNILLSLQKPRWLIAMANMMVVIHVIGSYQIYAMPVFDMLETVLVKKLHFAPGITLRLVARSAYVAFTMFIGMTFPFFGGLLGFFGGFAFAPTTYFLPCVMWLSICKPRRFSLSWTINWICIVLGLLLMTLAPIGGLRSIILKAKTYKFYS